MNTLRDLADHISGRLAWMPPVPLPDADTLPPDLLGMYARLREMEREGSDRLDRSLRANVAEGRPLDLTPWDVWFLDQRWRCAAQWISAAADSQPILTLHQPNSLDAVYEWLLIRLWRQLRDFHLQNCAVLLFAGIPSPAPPPG